jgi:hypothetical protein
MELLVVLKEKEEEEKDKNKRGGIRSSAAV